MRRGLLASPLQHGGGGRLDCEAVAFVEDLGLQVSCRASHRHSAVEPVARQSLGLGYQPGGAGHLGSEAHRDEIDGGGGGTGPR